MKVDGEAVGVALELMCCRPGGGVGAGAGAALLVPALASVLGPSEVGTELACPWALAPSCWV